MAERTRAARRKDVTERAESPQQAPAALPGNASAHSVQRLLAEQAADQRARVVEGLQRGAGNQAVGRWLARQPAPKTAPPQDVAVDFGWFEARHNVQLASGARILVSELEKDMQELPATSPARRRADELIQTVNDWLPYLDSKGNEPIERAVASQAAKLLEDYGKIRTAVQEEAIVPLRDAWRRAERAAERAAEEAEALQPRFDDALRSAFRQGSAGTVKDAVSAIKSAVSIGRNLRSLAYDISKEILKLEIPSGTKMWIQRPWDITKPIKVQIISVSKYTDMLTTLNRGLNVISIALTIADRSKRATQVEQGMKDLNDVVNVGTDAASLIGLPPHVSLYATMYIKPMLKAIMAQLGRLVMQLSDINRTSVAVTGDLMYPGAEPGGQPMFDFMVAVMHAERLDQVPKISGDVEEYFYDQRDKLKEGAEESVPTSGWWLWEDLDTGKARDWVFRNRKPVWAMFYGSMNVPNRKRK